MPLQETAHGRRIVASECVVDLRFERLILALLRNDVLPERRPVLEAVLAGDDELRVGQYDSGFVGQDGPDTAVRFGVSSSKGLEQLPGLPFLLVEIRRRRERSGERGRHRTPPSVDGRRPHSRPEEGDDDFKQ